MYCTKCGTEVRDTEETYCTNCGEKLDRTVDLTLHEHDKIKFFLSTKSVMRVVLLGICLFGGYFFYYNQQHSPQATIDRFVLYLENDNVQGVLSMLSVETPTLNEETAKALIRWVKQPGKMEEMKLSLRDQLVSIEQNKGQAIGAFLNKGKWALISKDDGIWKDYKVKVQTAPFTIRTRDAGVLMVSGIFDKPKEVKGDTSISYEPVLPGIYEYYYDDHRSQSAATEVVLVNADKRVEIGAYPTTMQKNQQLSVDFEGSGKPYDTVLYQANTKGHYLKVSKDGHLVNGQFLPNYGKVQIASVRGGKQDLLFAANAGSGGFLQGASVFGYDGTAIICLLDIGQFLKKTEKNPYGYKAADFVVQGNQVFLKYLSNGTRYQRELIWDQSSNRYTLGEAIAARM